MDDIMKKNIRAYDSSVEEYYDKTKSLEEPEMAQRRLFASNIKKAGKLLDLGCGPGRDCKIFSDWGFQVTGVDLSPASIQKAKIIAPKASFQIMGFTHLDFKGEMFDAIWFNAGLLCIEKKHAPKVLKSIRSILADDGTLFISVKEGEGEGFEFDKRYNLEKYYAYYALEEIRSLLERAGFEIIKSETLSLANKYHVHPWLWFTAKKADKKR
jgi:SAM-dependent methyltransferase